MRTSVWGTDSLANRSVGAAHRLAHILADTNVSIYFPVLHSFLALGCLFPWSGLANFDGAGQLRLRWILIAGYIRNSVLFLGAFLENIGAHLVLIFRCPACVVSHFEMAPKCHKSNILPWRKEKTCPPLSPRHTVTPPLAAIYLLIFKLYLLRLVATKSTLISTHQCYLDQLFGPLARN